MNGRPDFVDAEAERILQRYERRASNDSAENRFSATRTSRTSRACKIAIARLYACCTGMDSTR